MRKVELYFNLFWLPVLIVVTGVICWLFLSTIGGFRGILIGVALGVGLPIFIARGIQKGVEHRRRKRTFGLLKLIIIPNLLNFADNMLETFKSYNDMCSMDKAIEFFTLSSHYDVIAQGLDKEWLTLIYSQEFLDAIKQDEHFNSIATAIKELQLMIQQLSSQAVNAKVNIANDFSKFNHNQQQEIIKRAQEIRNQLTNSTQKFKQYTEQLDREITLYLENSGAKYVEYDR